MARHEHGGDAPGHHPQHQLLQQRASSANHYLLLGVQITATAEDIRVAYRRLARLWHPDRHQGDDGAKQKFQEIQGAYEVLSDPSRRHTYDLGLLELLDVEDYLNRFKELLLTASGLGMQSHRTCGNDEALLGHHHHEQRHQPLFPMHPRTFSRSEQQRHCLTAV